MSSIKPKSQIKTCTWGNIFDTCYPVSCTSSQFLCLNKSLHAGLPSRACFTSQAFSPFTPNACCVKSSSVSIHKDKADPTAWSLSIHSASPDSTGVLPLPDLLGQCLILIHSSKPESICPWHRKVWVGGLTFWHLLHAAFLIQNWLTPCNAPR